MSTNSMYDLILIYSHHISSKVRQFPFLASTNGHHDSTFLESRYTKLYNLNHQLTQVGRSHIVFQAGSSICIYFKERSKNLNQIKRQKIYSTTQPLPNHLRSTKSGVLRRNSSLLIFFKSGSAKPDPCPRFTHRNVSYVSLYCKIYRNIFNANRSIHVIIYYLDSS